jgi:hypothetical protein
MLYYRKGGKGPEPEVQKNYTAPPALHGIHWRESLLTQAVARVGDMPHTVISIAGGMWGECLASH